MDFKDLSYVIAIAKTQNITKAADMLYVTQPTLTKFLQNLEREMGQKLFKKLGNRFVLTYAGERYVAKATEILNLKKRIRPGDGRHYTAECRSFKNCFSNHAWNLYASLYTSYFPKFISPCTSGDQRSTFQSFRGNAFKWGC